MAKAKSGGSSSKGQKVSFTDQAKGKTTIGLSHSSIKFSTMNKQKRRSYKAYRGQGRP
jgi:hypothetical protein